MEEEPDEMKEYIAEFNNFIDMISEKYEQSEVRSLMHSLGSINFEIYFSNGKISSQIEGDSLSDIIYDNPEIQTILDDANTKLSKLDIIIPSNVLLDSSLHKEYLKNHL